LKLTQVLYEQQKSKKDSHTEGVTFSCVVFLVHNND